MGCLYPFTFRKVSSVGVTGVSWTSLEYLKYCGGPQLPTQFMEAEMEFFGAHSFDIVGGPDDPGEVKKGKHHYEWRPA